MTGWAATRRLLRELQSEFSLNGLALLIGTALAALLTSGATLLIFEERFLEGAWTYFLFIPVLYLIFGYFRAQLGDPGPVQEQLGEIQGASLGGFGYGQAVMWQEGPSPQPTFQSSPSSWRTAPVRVADWCSQRVHLRHLLVPLDGSTFAEQALPLAENLTRVFDAQLTLVSAIEENVGYLSRMAERMRDAGIKTDYAIGQGPVANATKTLVEQAGIDLVVTSTRGGSGARHWLTGGVASQIAQSITKPLLLVQSDSLDNGRRLRLRRFLVPLDGSVIAESVLPYVLTIAQAFDGEVILLSVPEVPEPSKFGAVIDWVEARRVEAEIESWKYLDSIFATVHDDCPSVRAMVTGSRAASDIVDVSAAERVDMIMMATHGRGGLDRLWLGSVAERVVQNTDLPVFLLPIHNGAAAEPAQVVLEGAVIEAEPH